MSALSKEKITTTLDAFNIIICNQNIHSCMIANEKAFAMWRLFIRLPTT